jgi:tRNA pseudouridine38-40 synthase
MLTHFKLTIEYDGTDFHGWQIQPDQPTIQDEIQKILSSMTQDNIIIHGSGRTDAGVHALGQVAHFACDTRISAERFQVALNLMLPKGIVIRECRKVSSSFHARFSARSKTYRYRILNTQIPCAVGRQYVWHIHRPLNIRAMQEAAGHLIGEKDFKSFEGTGSPRASTVRRIHRADFTEKDGLVTFEINGTGFLKFMVRNIVGTMVEVGLGQRSPDDFQKALLAMNRKAAGITAPPQGLFLLQVDYEPH